MFADLVASTPRPLRVLAVGSHPDDIELGAAALLLKAADEGHTVRMLVLTDAPAQAAVRRREAVAAAAELGIDADDVLFAGLVDGHLRANADSVRRVRDLAWSYRPDVVVTHTDADSHNDHVEAHRVAHAAFRNAVFLHFSIHVSSEASRFTPRLFVAVDGERLDRKNRSLAAHSSQRRTIERNNLGEYEASLGALSGIPRAEAFEVSVQWGASHNLHEVMRLSESPFHRFWVPLTRGGDVTLLYTATGPAAPDDGAEAHLNAGRDRLRDAFAHGWAAARTPLREQFAAPADLPAALRAGTTLLVGAPPANAVYDAVAGVRWSIRGEADRAHVLDRVTGRRLTPDRDADGRVHRDVGVIARVPNPSAPGATLVYAAGTTALGTRAGLEALADLTALTRVDDLLATDEPVEVAFAAQPGGDGIQILGHRTWPRTTISALPAA